MNTAQRSEFYGSKSVFLCLFSRASALLVTLILTFGLGAFAQTLETVATTVTMPNGQIGNAIAVRANTVAGVQAVAAAVEEVSQGNVEYVYPDTNPEGTPLENTTPEKVQQEIRAGKYEHIIGITATWAASTFSALYLSHTPISSRHASVVVTTLFSLSRLFKDDWQGDGVDWITKGLTGGFKRIGAQKLIEYKIPNLVSQYVFSLSMSTLQYQVQHFFWHHTLGFDWKLLLTAGIATFAAGTWEETLRPWVKFGDGPMSSLSARIVRETRRIIAAGSGPQLSSPVDAWPKYAAIATYSVMAATGLPLFYRTQIATWLERRRESSKMCSLSLTTN